ncbi:MAG: hypothetical protein WBC04_13995 [Candidatus Acidiferrales bacterium]
MTPLAPDQRKDLALGVLNLLNDEGGFATKTKLLKLLYLADIEAYRDQQTTLTASIGFSTCTDRGRQSMTNS